LETKEISYLVLDQWPEGVCVIDKKGDYLFVNQFYSQLLEIDKNRPGPYLKESFSLLGSGQFYTWSTLCEAIYSGKLESWNGEVGLNSLSDNRTLSCYLSPWKGTDEKIIGVMGRFSRLDKKEISVVSRLEALEDYSKALMNAVPGYISWFSDDLTYLGVNPRLAELFNLSPEDFVGKEIGFLNEDKQPGVFEKMVKDFFEKTTTNFQTEVELPIGEGGYQDQIILLTMQKYHQGHDVVLIGIDITEVKEYEKELLLERSRAEVNEKFASLGEIAAGVAHEVNNPLAIIKGYTSSLAKVLSSENPDTQKALSYTEKSRKACDRIASIVKGLKVLSRNVEDDPFLPIAIGEILEDAFSLTEGRLKRDGISLRVEVENLELLFECRSTNIVQVLVNLINNARDALNEFESKDKWVCVGSCVKGENILISVEDSGPGIPEDVKENVFKPFFTTKDVGKGTGLGLSLSYNFIKQHQGEFYLDETSNHTKFVMSLPCKQVVVQK